MLARGFIRPENQEPIIDGLEFYLDAYRELATTRPAGLGPAPIPFTAIVEYSRIYDIEDIDEFSYIIRVMDNTVLGWVDKGKPQGGNGGKSDANKAHKN